MADPLISEIKDQKVILKMFNIYFVIHRITTALLKRLIMIAKTFHLGVKGMKGVRYKGCMNGRLLYIL